MLSTKMPTEDGFYWVRFEDERLLPCICRLSVEDCEDGVADICGINRDGKMFDYHPEIDKVACWIGPLTDPFDQDFGGGCAYFSESDHVDASVEKKALVMVHVDGGPADKNIGTATSVGSFPEKEAFAFACKLFREGV